MLGYPREQLLRRRLSQLTHPDDIDLGTALFNELLDGTRDSYESQKRLVHADGHVVFGLLHVGVIRNSAGGIQSIVAQINDVTQRKHAEDRLAHRAMHDPLTELPNRTLLEELLAGYARRRPAGRRAVLRPGPLQDRQRQPRARGGRRAAAGALAPVARRAAGRGHAGPGRRRRVRGAGAGRGRPAPAARSSPSG